MIRSENVLFCKSKLIKRWVEEVKGALRALNAINFHSFAYI